MINDGSEIAFAVRVQLFIEASDRLYALNLPDLHTSVKEYLSSKDVQNEKQVQKELQDLLKLLEALIPGWHVLCHIWEKKYDGYNKKRV